MSLSAAGIEHKRTGETLIATIRTCLKDRNELRGIFADLARRIPVECIAGPAFSIIRFVTSVTEGDDVEIGFPVNRIVDLGEIRTRTMPALEVLALVHRGPVEGLGQAYRRLYGPAAELGVISDEFAREVYVRWDDPAQAEVELQFIVHRWNDLLAANLERVLGAEAHCAVMQGADGLSIESAVAERFAWAKGAMERLEGLAAPDQAYDVVSSCAHIFPREQIDKLAAIYQGAWAKHADLLAAVDAVIEFMSVDPGWKDRPVREGRVVYATKRPRNPQAHERAQTPAERRAAYCFCPVIRARLDAGMPLTYCNCGAGWFRQQWEGAIGRPVRIDIVESVLRGDEVCRFAVYLPEED
jgi:effector-binding domain-containing protein